MSVCLEMFVQVELVTGNNLDSLDSTKPEQGSLRGMWEGQYSPPPLLQRRIEHVGDLWVSLFFKS